MAITAPPAGLGAIQSLGDDTALLVALKDLKNSIIGNTWKKVEVADEDGLLRYLLAKTNLAYDEQIQLDIAGEIAVIIGAVASEGSLTIQQLLQAGAAEDLLRLIRQLVDNPTTRTTSLVVSSLRALRNVLISTADAVWGSAWGVGRERHVVGTGLVGPEGLESVEVETGEMQSAGYSEGKRVLGLVFETSNLDALLSLLNTSSTPQIALPLYQIFARLILQPSHRRILASWMPATTNDIGSSRSSSHVLVPSTYLLKHLAEVVTNPKTNTKVLEAALDLLAAFVKDEGSLAGDLCFFCTDYSDLRALRNPNSTMMEIAQAATAIRSPNHPKFVYLFETGSTAVQIAAAGCLTSIYRAEPKSAKFELGANIANHLLTGLVNLMSTKVPEDRSKLCFILAALVADDTTLQKIAASLEYPSLLQEILRDIEKDVDNGRVSNDAAARGREAALLGMTALASNLESTRTQFADGTLPILEYLREAINDPSYGVRAAACQLVRVLSRTVALVKTSLMDSGVASAVISMFANHAPSRIEEITANRSSEEWVDGGPSWSDRNYIVEITALTALCNLIADCIPLKQMLLNSAALTNIGHLANCPNETVVVNALWAFKNATFKSSETDKRIIVEAIGVRTLIKLASETAPTAVNIRALGVIQNYLADASLAELGHAVDKLGEAQLMGVIQSGLRTEAGVDLRVAALGVLVNLCYGNERLRLTIVGKPWIVLALVEAVDSPFDEVKVHGLRAIRNLITSTTRRPRIPILAPFRPYCIGPRVRRLVETSPSLDVTTAAIALNEILEKVRPGFEGPFDDPLDR